MRSYHRCSTSPDTVPSLQGRGLKLGTQILVKVGKLLCHLRRRVLEPGQWKGVCKVPGEGLLILPRRRTRRLGVSLPPIHPCAREGGKVEVRKDLSRIPDRSHGLFASCREQVSSVRTKYVLSVCAPRASVVYAVSPLEKSAVNSQNFPSVVPRSEVQKSQRVSTNI